MIGCHDKAAIAEIEQFKAKTSIEEQNKELVKRVFELWNIGDFEAYKELLSPEYSYYHPSNSTTPMSREEIIEANKILIKNFPDINWSIEELIAKDDKVITRFIFRATHQIDFRGSSPTGNEVGGSGILITRIENGKIVEDKEENDQLGLMMQLGMELKPKDR